MICPASLVISVSAAAAAIAEQMADEEVALLAAVLTQLGDSLTTVLEARNIIKTDKN